MMQPQELTAIEVRILDGHLVIPKGLTPVYAHTLGDRMIVHVETWTAAKEYDRTDFDLYSLDRAQFHIFHFRMNGEDRGDERWYTKFGPPTKQAKMSNGELVVRDRPE